jgi:SAM-dependent methyltransferase
VIEHGLIHCSNEACSQEYPIIDGIPILMPNVREYVCAYAPMILARSDLPGGIESLLGDCLGPDDQFNLTRYYLSSYAHDGFARDDDTDGVLAVCNAATGHLALEKNDRPVLDLGCSVGRSTFACAADTPALTLGVDMNFSMLRLARQALYADEVTYPRRRHGVVYEAETAATAYPNRDQVDFWACDVQSLPFADAAAGSAIGLNVLDSVHSPVTLLTELARMLTPGGRAVLTTPFDWSSRATPFENWIGGHSQRSSMAGSPEAALDAVLQAMPKNAALKIISRDEVSWSSTVSATSRVSYQDYLFVLEKCT